MNPSGFPIDQLAAQLPGPCLLSTIYACQVDPATGEVIDVLYDKAGKYCEVISKAIRDFHTHEYPTNDLMRYFKVPDDPGMETAVREKVRSAHVGVAAVGDTLYAGLRLDLAADLTPDEMAVFTEQIGSQYRDGWGAQFEILDIPAGEEGVAVRFWQDSVAFCTELASTRAQRQPDTELGKDTFWALIDQAKEHSSGPDKWLMKQLMDLGPEQAKRFDILARVYMDLAYQYGLWTAASVMDRDGGSIVGFDKFRDWLVCQGRGVYMAALRDPDSLADAPNYRGICPFTSLPYAGRPAYWKLTGRSVDQDHDPAEYRLLRVELARDIVYADGINHLEDQVNALSCVPRLCAKYLAPVDIKFLTRSKGYARGLAGPQTQAVRDGAKMAEGPMETGEKEYMLKLYTDLRVDVTETGPSYISVRQFPDNWMDGVERKRFQCYHSALLDAIRADPPEKDMTAIFKSDFERLPAFSQFAAKISSIAQTVEDVGGKFFGVSLCRVKGRLDDMEMQLLKEYCRALHDESIEVKQYHCPLSKYHDHLDIRIWREKGRFMLTEQEMERAPWRKPKQKNKGGEAR